MLVKPFVFVISFLICSTSVHADEDIGSAVIKEGVHAAFHELERQLIYRYFDDHVVVDHGYESRYSDHDTGYKKHKGKNKQLPPGIQKKPDRGGSLPPGIAKRNLPIDLEDQLPPAPRGYERVIVGNDVVLAEINTGIIADILTDAVLGE